MANRPITELDFFQIKEQLKEYLKTQTKFKDYDYEGSNMSVLLDVLAYNTYQNNFYTNMAISEMFLDSAQRENSIISHAKELNYLPRSSKSAMAVIELNIRNSTETTNSITIPKGTKFTTAYLGTNFVFYTKQVYIAQRFQGDLFKAKCVEIYEGEIVSEGFVFTAERKNYVLLNENIDISSLEVMSKDLATEYIFKSDIFGVNATDPVFYVEPSFDSLYSISFGQNVFGANPPINSEIKVRYQVSSGTAPNGANRFSSAAFPNSSIIVTSPANGGAEKEDLASIKFFAPKSIQIQERAVTSSDYSVLLKQRFPEIQAISVLGGDELDPPQYGKVAISVKLFDETTVSESLLSKYKNYITDKTPLAINPIFIQPKFNYVKLAIDISFSRNLSNKSTQELETLIRSAIQSFTNSNLNDFNKALRISRLGSIINELDASILSNSIVANPIIEYSPTKNLRINPSFEFGAELIKPYPYRNSDGLLKYQPAFYSTPFTYGTENAVLMDDGNGNVMVVNSDFTKNQILENIVGNINYTTGKIVLSDFAIQDYEGRAVSMIATTKDKDIKSLKNTIMTIRDKEVSISFTDNT